MKTDDLIARLADAPLGTHPIGATLAAGLAVGGAASLAIMLTWLHMRPDIMTAIGTAMFWIKLGYAAILATLVFPLVVQLSRPTGTLPRYMLVLLGPVAALAALALYNFVAAEPSERMHLIMGNSSNVCPWRIFALSLPILGAVFVSLRRLAPTRLALAGAAAGLLAGAAGTIIYALHCDESSAPFVVIWYTLGMSAVGIAGGLLGRALLRW